ncbi:MAG: tRNA lysidine(34) synthetase TilS [Cyanobacteria bacterium P01_D01_bin.128]
MTDTGDPYAPQIWSNLHARVHQTLRSRQLLPARSAVMVAVSGGQDSLCLLRLLLDLQSKWRWRLTAAHCDHRWPSDDGIFDFVAQQAARWQVPLVSASAVAPPTGESGARQWRYHTLTAMACAQNCTALVTGHTASDRAETLLFNLIRGSGLTGLKGLIWQRPLRVEDTRELNSGAEISLVRPLLNITRQTTEEFCQSRDIPVWQDVTNRDRRFARPRLRHELLPYLRQQFNPQVETTLNQTAELLATEEDYLTQAAQHLYNRAVAQVDGWRLHRPTLIAAHPALRRRVVRLALIQQMPSHPRFDQIEKVTDLLHSPNRSQSDPLPGGAIALVEGDWIVFKMHSTPPHSSLWKESQPKRHD